MDSEIVRDEKWLTNLDPQIKVIKATGSIHNLMYGLLIRQGGAQLNPDNKVLQKFQIFVKDRVKTLITLLNTVE